MSSTRIDEVVVQEHPEGLRVIRLGHQDEKTAVLTEARMDSLRMAVDRIRQDRGATGLVITGPNAYSFSAGADIHAIRGVSDAAVGAKLARMGQEIFGQIEALPIRTVAAISGPCVGGGCELVLACNYRLLLNVPESKIGLPEIKLGILPGFGGTQRLPRLIGLRGALDIILSGKVLDANRAFAYGLVDELVPTPGTDIEAGFRALEAIARELALGRRAISRKPLKFSDRMMGSTPWGRSLVRKKATASVLKETKGQYPAPIRALDVTISGLGTSLAAGFELEAKALGDLIITPESKNLVHLFLLSERAQKLGRYAKIAPESTGVAVIGGGVMGAGIAATAIMSGFPVVLVEPIEAARKKAESHVHQVLEAKRSLTPEARVRLLQSLKISERLEDVAQASFILEAIVEDLVTKQQVLTRVREFAGPEAIIASNTSSLSIEALSAAIPAPERIAGLHFFNPVEKMPLVEIVRSRKTSDETTLRLAGVAAKLGKSPVVVEDVAGFLVNRVLTPYIAEAGTLLMEGISIEAIDSAALEFGLPMGPIRLLDEVGLDVGKKVQEIITGAYGGRMKAPDFLDRLVAAGRLGKKGGVGFYQYGPQGERVDTSVYSILGQKAESLSAGDRRVIQDRLILALINEAVRAFDEGVAGAPGEEAAGQIDLATVMGMGFPPFRGGALRYAERLGPKALLLRMQGLHKSHGERFKPWEGIQIRAERGGSFYAACDE